MSYRKFIIYLHLPCLRGFLKNYALMCWHVYFSRCINVLYMRLGLQLFSVEALRHFICSRLEAQIFCRQEFDQGQWRHSLLAYLFGEECHQGPCASCFTCLISLLPFCSYLFVRVGGGSLSLKQKEHHCPSNSTSTSSEQDPHKVTPPHLFIAYGLG